MIVYYNYGEEGGGHDALDAEIATSDFEEQIPWEYGRVPPTTLPETDFHLLTTLPLDPSPRPTVCVECLFLLKCIEIMEPTVCPDHPHTESCYKG